MARRALDAAGSEADVIAVSRFGDTEARQALERHAVRTVICDLLDPESVVRLPDAGAVLFLAGAKFGTSADPAGTWAANAWLPGLVAARYRGVPTVAFFQRTNAPRSGGGHGTLFQTGSSLARRHQ